MRLDPHRQPVGSDGSDVISSRPLPRVSGFTLIESLVALSIIGIISALLLPAIQAARDSSRRLHCSNNLRQIGLSLHGYHSSWGYLPPGRVSSSDRRYFTDAVACSGVVDRSFLVDILPHMEQNALYNAMNLTLAVLGPENCTVRGAVIATFVCPGDPQAASARLGSLPQLGPGPAPDLSRVGLTNYSGFMGSVYSSARPISDDGCRADPAQILRANGTINDLDRISFATIIDGLSHTAIVSERRVGLLSLYVDPLEPRAAEHYAWWFLGDFGCTLMAANLPPNVYKHSTTTSLGALFASASSTHANGVNVLFGDGSVRFVADSVQSWARETNTGNLPSSLGVWQALATRAGGELIEDGSF